MLNDEAKSVAYIPSGDGKTSAKTGKPKKVATTTMRTKFAGSSTGGLGGAGTTQGSGGNFYSPELSTDFLELPQSLHENWNYYRFFYRSEPYVGQAVDLHTELPLSKVRISKPKIKNEAVAAQATRFCIKWAERIGLLHRLISIVHDRNLIGEVFIWCEDANPEMPREIREQKSYVLTEQGEPTEDWTERPDADERASAWLKKNYKGWTGVRVLPPEQVHMESFSFTDARIFELIPDSKTKDIIQKADMLDANARRVVDSMPTEVVAAVRAGKNIPLNTDPMAGSFVHYLANRKSDYEPRGRSILERCMRVLVYRDKLRQAQTSISSRHMTPIRLIWAADMDAADTDALRDQIDLALQDPDYSIVSNFEVSWNEMGADQRLLDLSTEYDITNSQLYAGLGVTEGLLSGESSYSGDKINLEVINTRYMLLREQIQELVENSFFKPMCARMGFVDVDEDGDEFVVVPKLSFTRLALRDNQDTFDALYNLYTKGSLDVETILDLLNLDPTAVRERVEKDLFTVNDPTFNEVMRGIYTDAGRKLVEESNVTEKLARTLGLKHTPPKEEEGGRF
jgi:hypothetical protein